MYDAAELSQLPGLLAGELISIGRARPSSATATDGEDTTPARPTPRELKRWQKDQARADRERTDRARRALQNIVAQLAEDDTEYSPLCALVAMFDGYWLRQQRDSGNYPTAEQLAKALFAAAWKHAETVGTLPGRGNRTPLRNLLSRAGISPDVVDPPDQTLRLLDIGQQTLLGYEEARLRVDRGELNHRLRRLRDALAEFDAAPAVVSASDELTTLARYLTAAVEREEMLLAAQQQEAPAPAD